MKTQQTPRPWLKGVYAENECLCREDGCLIAIFGPEGDTQSIIDRDAAGHAVNSHEALLDLSEGVLLGLQKIADAADKIPEADKLQEFALFLHSHIEDQLKAIANMEGRI